MLLRRSGSALTALLNVALLVGCADLEPSHGAPEFNACEGSPYVGYFSGLPAGADFTEEVRFDLYGLRPDGSIDRLTHEQKVFQAGTGPDAKTVYLAYGAAEEDLYRLNGQIVDAGRQMDNGRRVATYDVTTKKLDAGSTMPGVDEIAVSPDGNQLAIIAWDGAWTTSFEPTSIATPTVNVWLAPRAEPRQASVVAKSGAESVRNVSWNPDGNRIAYIAGQIAYILELETGDVSSIFEAGVDESGTAFLSSLDWSPDGAHLFIKQSMPAISGHAEESLYGIEVDVESGTAVDMGPMPGQWVTYAGPNMVASIGYSPKDAGKQHADGVQFAWGIQYWARNGNGKFEHAITTTLRGLTGAIDLQIADCAIPN